MIADTILLGGSGAPQTYSERSCPTPCCHSEPDVDRRHRIPLAQVGQFGSLKRCWVPYGEPRETVCVHCEKAKQNDEIELGSHQPDTERFYDFCLSTALGNLTILSLGRSYVGVREVGEQPEPHSLPTPPSNGRHTREVPIPRIQQPSGCY